MQVQVLSAAKAISEGIILSPLPVRLFPEPVFPR